MWHGCGSLSRAGRITSLGELGLFSFCGFFRCQPLVPDIEPASSSWLSFFPSPRSKAAQTKLNRCLTLEEEN